MKKLISTDIDKFFNIIFKKKEISQNEILKEMNLDINVIEKYAQILENKNKIKIKYPILKKAVYILNEDNLNNSKIIKKDNYNLNENKNVTNNNNNNNNNKSNKKNEKIDSNEEKKNKSLFKKIKSLFKKSKNKSN
ncbi:MAG: hypothetical protein ACLFPJ_04400 [Candidatus Woesearchaeota archaeon]